MKKIVVLGLIVNLPAYLSRGTDAWTQHPACGIFLSYFFFLISFCCKQETADQILETIFLGVCLLLLKQRECCRL